MKNKIIELIDALREELTPNAYIKIANAIQSLPEDEPDLLPFGYPVKEGYEVVTRDGRQVEQLHKFDVPDFCIYGVIEDKPIAWTIEGKFEIIEMASKYDLFLRPIEKKVWVVEWKDDMGCVVQTTFKSIDEAVNWRDSVASREPIYEATLKHVV